MLFIALAAAAPLLSAGANIHLRAKPTVCWDFTGATDQAPIKAAACVAGSASQVFSYEPSESYIVLGSMASCQEGPPCCAENFFGGDISIWGCSDPSGKKFSYSNMTGTIGTSNGCVTAPATAGAALAVRPCNSSDAMQVWDLVAGPAPPAPHGDACKQFGCDGPWVPGRACQCNADCCSYNNCCTDFHSTCGACRNRPPAPPPWPCTPCWRCGNCPPSPPGTNCPTVAGAWTYNGGTVQVTQDRCAIDAKGPSKHSWQTAIGSFTTEWNVELKVVAASGSSAEWNGHLNGCSAGGCTSGDTITWTEPGGVTAVWTKQ